MMLLVSWLVSIVEKQLDK